MIALYKGKSILSLFIKFRTWSRYSHAAWLDPDGWVIQSWQGGVTETPNLSEGHTDGTVVDIFDFRIPLRKFELKHIREFLRAEKGKGYDYWGIFGFIFRRHAESRTRWFCSELIAAACAFIRRVLLVNDVWKISPGDIAVSPVLRKIGTIVTQKGTTPEKELLKERRRQCRRQ